MERIIKSYDPSQLTTEFLYDTNDWDLVELNLNLDVDKLSAWYNTVSKEFNNMRFMFDKFPERLKLSVSKQMVEQGYCGIYCGPIDGITMAWPTERYEPLPPPMQANTDFFPEVNYDTFLDDAKIMSKFKTGYFQEMLDFLGEDSFKQSIITTHYPGMFIKQHIDSKVLKLHIPLETNDDAFFVFGENKERGRYNLKVGKVYLLNTGDWHGTENNGTTPRSHIITRITAEQIQHIIRL